MIKNYFHLCRLLSHYFHFNACFAFTYRDLTIPIKWLRLVSHGIETLTGTLLIMTFWCSSVTSLYNCCCCCTLSSPCYSRSHATFFGFFYRAPSNNLLFLDYQWLFFVLNSDFIYLDRLLIAVSVVWIRSSPSCSPIIRWRHSIRHEKSTEITHTSPSTICCYIIVWGIITFKDSILFKLAY